MGGVSQANQNVTSKINTFKLTVTQQCKNCIICYVFISSSCWWTQTRMLSYRKDDRAMRPI